MVIVTIDITLLEKAVFPQGGTYSIIYGLPQPLNNAISILSTSGGTIPAFISSGTGVLKINCSELAVTKFLHGQLVYFTD